MMNQGVWLEAIQVGLRSYVGQNDMEKEKEKEKEAEAR